MCPNETFMDRDIGAHKPHTFAVKTNIYVVHAGVQGHTHTHTHKQQKADLTSSIYHKGMFFSSLILQCPVHVIENTLD